MADTKLLFLGSKQIGYECFRYLLEEAGNLGVTPAGLLTRPGKAAPGADLLRLAAEHGVPVFGHPDEMPECDILYSVQYHAILKPAHIARAARAAVNLHMAPLPEYRGCNPFTWAILEEREEFGTTIHLIDPGIDSGAILFQKRFPVPPGCWVSDLHKLTFEASLRLFCQTLPNLIAGRYDPVDQSLLVPRYGTSLHYRNEIETLKQLDLNWDREKLLRHIRATSMPGFEPPWFIVDGKKMYITSSPA